MPRKRRRKTKTRKNRKKIVITVKGDLSKFGYRMSNSEATRIRALKMAVKKYGYAPVVRKLVALMVLNKNRLPRFSRMIKRDLRKLREWWEKKKR